MSPSTTGTLEVGATVGVRMATLTPNRYFFVEYRKYPEAAPEGSYYTRVPQVQSAIKPIPACLSQPTSSLERALLNEPC